MAAIPSRWRASPRGSVPMCSFIPKCHRVPFLVWRVSGSRALLLFPVDDGAEMMVASTMLPSFSRTPRSARRSPISRTAAAPVRGAPAGGGSRDRRLVRNLFWTYPSKASDALGLAEQVVHRRVAQVAEQLHAVHAQRPRMHNAMPTIRLYSEVP